MRRRDCRAATELTFFPVVCALHWHKCIRAAGPDSDGFRTPARNPPIAQKNGDAPRAGPTGIAGPACAGAGRSHGLRRACAGNAPLAVTAAAWACCARRGSVVGAVMSLMWPAVRCMGCIPAPPRSRAVGDFLLRRRRRCGRWRAVPSRAGHGADKRSGAQDRDITQGACFEGRQASRTRNPTRVAARLPNAAG